MKKYININFYLLKLEKMDKGQFIQAMEYVKRNLSYGDMILMNRYGKILEFERDDFRKNKYQKKLKGIPLMKPL